MQHYMINIMKCWPKCEYYCAIPKFERRMGNMKTTVIHIVKSFCFNDKLVKTEWRMMMRDAVTAMDALRFECHNRE